MVIKINGFDHENRGIGIRHLQLILPSVICSTQVSRRIANEVDGVTFAHQHGCAIIGDDVAGIDNFFADLAAHPNVGSVLIVGLGCETIQGQELSAKLIAMNRSTKYQITQENGGMQGTFDAGVRTACELAKNFPAKRAPITELIVGIDASREEALIDAVQTELKSLGVTTITVDSHGSSAQNFSELMRKRAMVIISFPSPEQPASGFPLIPVINIASKSALHIAIADDFDLSHNATAVEIADKVFSIAAGEVTIAEKNITGEILAPRLVRSV